MKPVLIVEHNTSSLRPLNENATGEKDWILSGTFTEFGVKNRNERIYTAEKFLPCLNELNERITTMGVVYGEFDHPDVFDTSLSRASHLIKSTRYVNESNKVEGEIKLLNTYWGKEAKALVQDGCPIFVSSRAAGITESDGTVTLKKLFTYDIVADPGFASAKMEVRSLNESFGFNSNANFRIYEMSNDSKINDLFNMNKNEFVTKQQLTDYSKYLVKELASTKEQVTKAIKTGNVEPKKLDQMMEYYENLNTTSTQIVKYLDYLSEKVQIVVNENNSLKETASKLMKHNDYLAENLEKAIGYTEYLAENLDKNIEYSEYLAENLDKNISYAEYLAENVDKNISYSEYIAENLDKNIAYSEYLAENLDKNIAYSEYIAENLSKNIDYSEYLAEHVDNTIAYSEYLAEHVEGNIKYSEYLAENLDDTIAYSDYIAESLDKTITYAGMITEKLNGSKLNESIEGGKILTLEDYGFEAEEEVLPIENGQEEGAEEELLPLEDGEENIDDVDGEEQPQEGDESIIAKLQDLNAEEGDLLNALAGEESVEGEESAENLPLEGEEAPAEGGQEEGAEGEEDFDGGADEDETQFESNTDLSKQIDTLIAEAKKRKASETSDLHFLKFLNKSQADSFNSLTNEERELVTVYLNENTYFSSADVLRLMNEALSTKNESMEEKLIRLMPENIKPIWEQMNESSKKSILSQARLYPDLNSEQKVEHFWLTRNLKKNESTKKLVSHEAIIQEDKLSDNEMNSILERFKNL
jgi:hypothetical protein